MARIFIALLLLIPLTAVGLWLQARPGQVLIDWLGYHITLSHMAAFMLLIGLLVLTITLSVLLHGLWQWPKHLSTARRLSRYERGMALLTRGISAYAAGDNNAARSALLKASKALPQSALPHLLAAQANSVQHADFDKATPHLKALTEHTATAYIGYKRLLENAKRKGESKEYTVLLQKARKAFPYDNWLAERYLVHCVASEQYEMALNYLRGFHLRHAFSRARRKALIAAIEFIGNPQNADTDSRFYLPYLQSPNTALPAANFLAQHAQPDEMPSIIPALWRCYKQHPQKPLRDALVLLYLKLNDAAQKRFKKRAAKMARKSPDAALLMACMAFEKSQFREAIEYAEKAYAATSLKQAASLLIDSYKALDEHERVEYWYEQALSAQDYHGWSCHICDTKHDQWQLVCTHCEAMDSVFWQETSAQELQPQAVKISA
jgi:HemY protein